MKPNTVFGVPERGFCKVWVSLLWKAMQRTGKGYRRPSQRRTGEGEDRRKDKPGTTKLSRSLALQQVARPQTMRGMYA